MNKRNSTIIILIIIVISGYFMILNKSTSDNLVVKLSSLKFQSSKDDNSIMEVRYMLGV